MQSILGIVYGFHCTRTNMWYIGQSEKSLMDRYSFEWWDSVRNRHLVDALKRYGYEAFDVWIFDNGLDRKERDVRERDLVRQHSAYHPAGYNLAPAGTADRDDVMAVEHRISLRHKNARPFRVKEVATGRIHEGVNLNEFCRERGICRTNVDKAMKRGLGHVAGGFTHPDTTQDDIDNLSFKSNTNIALPFTIYRGKEPFAVANVPTFCRKHGLCGQTFSEFMRGEHTHYRGFTKVPLDSLPRTSPRYCDIVLRNRDGTEAHYDSPQDYERVTTVRAATLLCLLRGVTKTCHGSTLVSVGRR